MLIDNAIVVIESIFRNREQGLERREAIITGTTEVSGAVVAATLDDHRCLYSHRIPAWRLGAAVQGAGLDSHLLSLLSSLFVALLVIPMLYDQFTKRKGRPT
ncbi:MAG: efflux RND transporter permease subunit [Fermentimonas sp.]